MFLKKLSRTGFVLSLAFCSTLARAVDFYPATTPALGRTFPQWSAEFWQFSLALPNASNPLLETNGSRCEFAQRGPVWFLFGSWSSVPAGPIVRNCKIPAGKALLVPVYTNVEINSPNVCGDGPLNQTVAQLRAKASNKIADANVLSLLVDGQAVPNLTINNPQFRVASSIFDVTLPESNIFDPLCAGVSNVPKGVYTPAVSDGVYVLLKPLPTGTHTVQIQVSTFSGGSLDVKYNLNVVAVRRQ